jgi:hypothetical protein
MLGSDHVLFTVSVNHQKLIDRPSVAFPEAGGELGTTGLAEFRILESSRSPPCLIPSLALLTGASGRLVLVLWRSCGALYCTYVPTSRVPDASFMRESFYDRPT